MVSVFVALTEPIALSWTQLSKLVMMQNFGVWASVGIRNRVLITAPVVLSPTLLMTLKLNTMHAVKRGC